MCFGVAYFGGVGLLIGPTFTDELWYADTLSLVEWCCFGNGQGAEVNKIFRKMAMRKFLFLWNMTLVSLAFSQTPDTQNVGLKKSTSAAPDIALAGDVTRKQAEQAPTAPIFQYDQFRLDVELQVASKRREQIADLNQIIQLGVDEKEMPNLLFRLGGLYWEEARYHFIEASRKDDEMVAAIDRQDKGAQARIAAEKKVLLGKQVEYGQLANRQYADVVQRYKNYARNDEVLFFLGHNSFNLGETSKGLVAFEKLIKDYPKSRFVPDTYIVFGQYYFNNSQGKTEQLKKALDAFQKAAAYPDNQAFAYALYMQGWCHYNLGEFAQAKEQFKSVILYGELAGRKAVEGEKGRPDARIGLIREAMNDFVRAYARGGGTPGDAKMEFARVSKKEEERFNMLKQLANFYYQEGSDREAAVAFDLLIQERPLSPEAPGFQGKIVDCVMRAGNKPMTVAQVRKLVKILTQVEASGTITEAKDKIALSEARDLAERTISNLAVNWHKEGSKTRNEETFQFANDVYADYMTLFPDSKKAYELRFFWAELLFDLLHNHAKAAEQYGMVADEDVRRIESKQAPGKWLKDAAYNAILAYNEVVVQAKVKGSLKAGAERASRSSPPKPRQIPEEYKRLLAACDRYLKYVPGEKSQVEIAYIAAKVYYDHNHLEEASERFIEIAEKYPNAKFGTGKTAGELSAHLALNCYEQLQQWEKLHQTAVRFYRNNQLAKGELKRELGEIVESSAFKLVELFEQKGEHNNAAEAYMSFARNFPTSKLAAQALFNAALGYAKAKRFNKAIETRQLLIKQHSSSQYYPETLYLLAQDFVMAADFELAAGYFEQYFLQYSRTLPPGATGAKRSTSRAAGKHSDKTVVKPKESEFGFKEDKAQTALFNALSFRTGLGQPERAVKNGDVYLGIWPNSKEADEVFWAVVRNMEKLGRGRQAIRMLEEYAEQKRRSPNAYVTAQAKLFALARGANMRTLAARASEELRTYFKRLPKKNVEELGIETKESVALAFYDEAESGYQHYLRLRVRLNDLNNAAQFQETVKAKELSLAELLRVYTGIVGVGSPGYAICASGRLGDAYADMAQNFLEMPNPRGMPAELEAEFRGMLQERALPFSKEAVVYYQASVHAARKNNLSNRCSQNALEQLRNKYRIPGFEQRRELLMNLDTKQQVQPTMLTTQAAAPEAPLTQEQVRRLTNAIHASHQIPIPAKDVSPASESLKESNDEPL